MMKRALSYAGLLATAMLLHGCGGGAAGTAPAAGGSAVLPATHAAPFNSRHPRQGRVLFVATSGAAVTLFPADIRDQNPKSIGSITQGLTQANDVLLDRKGTLYVTNGPDSPSVVEYKRGQNSPFKTITNGLHLPGSVAVDSGLSLYVSDIQGGTGGPVILVYPPGADSPSETITMPKITGGMAFDPKGDLILVSFSVESQTGTVYSIAPGSKQPVDLGLQDLPDGAALGIDRAGYIYVGGVSGDISVYAPGSQTPSRYITVKNGGGFYSGFAVTPNGTIYWPNEENSMMYEFAPGASGPTNVFSDGRGFDAAVGAW